MILIISQPFAEESTNKVIDWLHYFGANWKRINGIDLLKNCTLNSETTFSNIVDFDSIGVVWMRRWLSKNCYADLFPNKLDIKEKKFLQQILHYQKQEVFTVSEFIFDSVPKEKKFNRFSIREINKLTVLKKAKLLGLNIPDTLVTCKKVEFNSFKNTNNKLITKAISNATGVKVEGKLFKGYTAEVQEIPSEVGDSFFISLFQKNIDKEIEIRSFYLGNKIWSMAIFSQLDETTSIDFRNYNFEKPNRTVPFKLSYEIETKLIELANFFDLNCASFDLIKSKNGDFIFLEVNPGGQFGMTSYPCNYKLEKEIAIELIKKDEKYNFKENK